MLCPGIPQTVFTVLSLTLTIPSSSFLSLPLFRLTPSQQLLFLKCILGSWGMPPLSQRSFLISPSVLPTLLSPSTLDPLGLVLFMTFIAPDFLIFSGFLLCLCELDPSLSVHSFTCLGPSHCLEKLITQPPLVHLLAYLGYQYFPDSDQCSFCTLCIYFLGLSLCRS